MLARLLFPGAWPSRCAVCQRWPAQTICPTCAGRFAPAQARCETCALPVPPGVPRCGACLAAPPPLERCLVAAAYQWPWSGLIARLKFQQDVGLAGPLAALLRQASGVAEALALARTEARTDVPD